eukprot:11085175-Alexandrium_andersonii.AAC.1
MLSPTPCHRGPNWGASPQHGWSAGGRGGETRSPETDATPNRCCACSPLREIPAQAGHPAHLQEGG